MPTEEFITMAHGSGGESTGRLIDEIFAEAFRNPYLEQMEDSTVVPGAGRLALTTDSFVVLPVEYPGGDIGRLCVCGTVNDLLMSGAKPAYLTCGFILEEGLPVETLRRIVRSMAETAKEAGVVIAAGDTKVVEAGQKETGPGLVINTAGVGLFDGETDNPALLPQISRIADGDAVIVSGTLGEHHAAILGERMGIKHTIRSDTAPLTEMVQNLKKSGIALHEMRDVTRGGLATVLHEFAHASGHRIILEEAKLPVQPQVRDFCGILGLDPLYMGNEGKMVLLVRAEDADKAMRIMRSSRYGEGACVIGSVCAAQDGEAGLMLRTGVGGLRVLGPLYGEGLPRIC